jgi:2-amino-4-hydroxy-6-hydroxymethyldihydropteridine diphosphokinase
LMQNWDMICFSLGSNLGDKLGYLRKAVSSLKEVFGNPLLISSVYETEGWGVENHPVYLNAVICFHTNLTPEVVLGKILDIEKTYGRERNSDSIDPRTIDIDILFYDDIILKKENLIIPHPLLKYRKFVLLPLSEIMGDYLHPEFGVSINELLERCEDLSGVSKTELSLVQ